MNNDCTINHQQQNGWFARRKLIATTNFDASKGTVSPRAPISMEKIPFLRHGSERHCISNFVSNACRWAERTLGTTDHGITIGIAPSSGDCSHELRPREMLAPQIMIEVGGFFVRIVSTIERSAGDERRACIIHFRHFEFIVLDDANNVKRSEWSELRRWCESQREQQRRWPMWPTNDGRYHWTRRKREALILRPEKLQKLKDIDFWLPQSYEEMYEELSYHRAETGALETVNKGKKAPRSNDEKKWWLDWSKYLDVVSLLNSYIRKRNRKASCCHHINRRQGLCINNKTKSI